MRKRVLNESTKWKRAVKNAFNSVVCLVDKKRKMGNYYAECFIQNDTSINT